MGSQVDLCYKTSIYTTCQENLHTVTVQYLRFVFHLCTSSLHPRLDIRPPAQFSGVHVHHTTPNTDTPTPNYKARRNILGSYPFSETYFQNFSRTQIHFSNTLKFTDHVSYAGSRSMYRSIYWSLVDRYSTDTRPMLDRCSTDARVKCRLSIDRCNDRYSVDIFRLIVDISVDSVGDLSVECR